MNSNGINGSNGNKVKELWINDEKPILCSATTCINGHMWQPQLAVAQCTGCKSWVLCLRMIMCPACNEPALQHELRVDHIAHGMKAGTALCKGERCEGDVMHVVMKAEHPTVDSIKGPTLPASISLTTSAHTPSTVENV